MVTITNATNLGLPNEADAGDIEQDQLRVGSTGALTRLSNRYTDLVDPTTNLQLIDETGLLINANLRMQDIQLWLASFRTGGTTAAATAILDTDDCVFNIMYDGTAQTAPTARGIWDFTNGRILRRSGGGIYIFGNATTDGAWRLMANGLDIESYGGNLTFHTGGLDVDNSVVNGVRLIGNSTAQLNARSAQFGFAAANAADTQAFDSNGVFNGTQYGYSIRFVHQLIPTSNIADDDTNNPQEYALYTNADLSNITLAGSDFSTNDNNGQSVIQINRLASVWLLNPAMGNNAGEASAGDDMLVGFHSGNPPNVVANAAEIRTWIADRQTFQDDTGADVLGTKVSYSAHSRLIPAAYARATAPTTLLNNEVTVNDSNYTGVMVQSQRNFFSGRTSAATRNPAAVDNRINPLRTDIVRTVRNFRYDFPYETNVVYNPNIMTALLTATPTPNEGIDLAEYLNGHATAGDAPASGTSVTSVDDIFPALRRNWYEGTPTTALTVTGTGGNNITFADSVSMSDNRVTEVNSDGTTAVNLATTVTAGVINSLTFNATVSSLNNVALPALTINGTGLLDVLGTTFAAGTTIGIAELRDVQANHFANDLTFTGNTVVDVNSAQDSFYYR